MRSTLSENMRRAMHAQETGAVILPLITLTQEDWEDEIRLVPNTEPVTRLGKVFEPLAFNVSLPDEEAEGVPVVGWTADNVDRRLVQALRLVRGVVQASIVWVLAETPDIDEWPPLEVEMRAAEYDALTISGTMSVETILEQQFGSKVFNPANTPGIF
ncbi:DUF1833 domain-containing protein [Leisingera sp. S132]|uniref:DUF1833 domain-containing protein n=1 Tax=Leisingera sp. S132 TaxID=2867016 RepID=UPI0021A49EDC|nr:DUF1833 domain-containing protein [Leisingera sp. S132]UWQ77604.1 DUF1833 domain-containing protein [Leisingera sp. S132]